MALLELLQPLVAVLMPLILRQQTEQQLVAQQERSVMRQMAPIIQLSILRLEVQQLVLLLRLSQ